MKWASAFLFLLLWSSALAFTPTPELLEGIEYYFQEEFTQAEALFLDLIQADTLNPVGYYFLALTYQAEMLDLESDFKEEEFKAAIEKSIRLSQKLLKENDKNKLAFFTLGNSYGNWALQQA